MRFKVTMKNSDALWMLGGKVTRWLEPQMVSKVPKCAPKCAQDWMDVGWMLDDLRHSIFPRQMDVGCFPF